MDWLLNERTALAFVFERWFREQGAAGEQKAIMLLYPYGLQFFEMFSEHLEPKTAHSFDIAWRRWSPEQHDSAAQQRALDELTQAMKNQRQFGNFPFILYLKDEEIATLLQDEDPLPSLMVLDGILPARRSTILDLLGAEATAEILSSYPDMHDLKFDAYSELSSRLFKKLKTQREGKEARNEAAYRSVLQAIEEQSIKQQAIMVENMRSTNPDMYNYVRERVTLWSDVAGLDSNILQEALQGMESDKLAALLRDDEELQERILPLRPAREQLLIRDQISQGVYNADLTDQLRLDFLGRVRRIKNFQAANAPASSAVTA
jgi:flagellar motor switch protein FliG